jgi:hypothetical protein
MEKQGEREIAPLLSFSDGHLLQFELTPHTQRLLSHDALVWISRTCLIHFYHLLARSNKFPLPIHCHL